jgi:hypothetical protein
MAGCEIGVNALLACDHLAGREDRQEGEGKGDMPVALHRLGPLRRPANLDVWFSRLREEKSKSSTR